MKIATLRSAESFITIPENALHRGKKATSNSANTHSHTFHAFAQTRSVLRQYNARFGAKPANPRCLVAPSRTRPEPVGGGFLICTCRVTDLGESARQPPPSVDSLVLSPQRYAHDDVRSACITDATEAVDSWW